MPKLMQVGRVLVAVSDQDAAIALYTETLGFSLTADVPFGEGERWVEVTPPGVEPLSLWCRPGATTSPGG